MNNTGSVTSILPLVARILIGLLFLVAGVRKIMGWTGTIAYFSKLGLPMPEPIVVLVILLELVGAMLLIVGWRTKLVAWALAGFTLVAGLMAHQFWAAEPAQYANQLNHFLKNLAIIGGLLMVVAFGPGSAAVESAKQSRERRSNGLFRFLGS